ncbi:MAG: electron transport complex subunit RsxG [Thiobacillus sp.]|nr:electron transport complex subunit RsxG [Thiobacillus sp.]
MTSLVQPAVRNALRTGIILLAFAVIGTAMLVLTFHRTQPHIERSQQAAKLALLSQVLPQRLYDNDLLSSRRTLAPDARLGTRAPSALWIARRGNTVTAVALEAVAPDGYSGDIQLLIGIDMNGTITGVRVTGHRETPGLGDYIERGKSAWIEQFVGKSHDRPPVRAWKVSKDGGAFDARAGATITPRAVVKAVSHALDYYSHNRNTIAAMRPARAPSGSKEK